jgi:hypothetical protein
MNASNTELATTRRYRSEETIFLLLRRAHANTETLRVLQ